MPGLLQLALLVALLAVTVPVLGGYVARVFDDDGPPAPGERVFGPVERLLLRAVGADRRGEQRWTAYAASLLAFSAVSVVLLYALQRFQHVLPGNPTDAPAVPPLVSFNTAISFVTNTNWQSYAGESTMSHLTQTVGLAVQQFASAGVGLCVAMALVRALRRTGGSTIGSFWVDLVRGCLRVLLPLALVVAAFYVSQGVVMNLHGDRGYTTLEGARAVVPGGPVASFEAIKQVGQNGGGFFNANSAHPFENPSGLTNLVHLWSILALPLSLCWTFGRLVKDRRQGLVVLGTMVGILAVCVGLATAAERSGGTLEGKETRFGTDTCAVYAVATTSTSNGAVNCAHDSLSPAAGGVALVDMMLGEVTPGGTGSGLYGMLVFAILAVFIAGLMVGRTPEYLGKKIQAAEMKLGVLYLLAAPLAILGFAATAAVLATATSQLGNPGPHGLTELVYAYTSAGQNNGSAFGGITVTSRWFQTTLGVTMLVGRYLLIVPVLAIAGSLVRKRKVPATAGTFPTGTPLFGGLLAGVVVVIVGLTYFPVLALGPIVEALSR